LNRRDAGADIEDEIRPHDLRGTVAGELLDTGTGLATVARLLGHANVAITVRYDRRPGSCGRAGLEAPFPPTDETDPETGLPRL
jgi:integrase